MGGVILQNESGVPPLEQKKTGIVIPKEKLSQQAIDGLVEEFILREGTEYGQKEYSLEEKKKHILNQLKSNHIVILFDPQIENTTLLTKDQIKKHHKYLLLS